MGVEYTDSCDPSDSQPPDSNLGEGGGSGTGTSTGTATTSGDPSQPSDTTSPSTSSGRPGMLSRTNNPNSLDTTGHGVRAGPGVGVVEVDEDGVVDDAKNLDSRGFWQKIGDAFNLKGGLGGGYHGKVSFGGRIGIGGGLKFAGGMKVDANSFNGVWGEATADVSGNVWRFGGRAHLFDVDVQSDTNSLRVENLGVDSVDFDSKFSASATVQPFSGSVSIDFGEVYNAIQDEFE